MYLSCNSFFVCAPAKAAAQRKTQTDKNNLFIVSSHYPSKNVRSQAKRAFAALPDEPGGSERPFLTPT
jgi:hypothetical protein